MFEELYNDSIFLRSQNKLKSSVLIQFCLIDAYAQKYYPDIKDHKIRYCKYLKRRLAEHQLDTRYRIEERDQLVHLSEIIYKYFRCFFVHEADDRSDSRYEVQMEYDEPGRFRFGGLVLQDRVNNKFVIKCSNLINILELIVNKEIENNKKE